MIFSHLLSLLLEFFEWMIAVLYRVARAYLFSWSFFGLKWLGSPKKKTTFRVKIDASNDVVGARVHAFDSDHFHLKVSFSQPHCFSLWCLIFLCELVPDSQNGFPSFMWHFVFPKCLQTPILNINIINSLFLNQNTCSTLRVHLFSISVLYPFPNETDWNEAFHFKSIF